MTTKIKVQKQAERAKKRDGTIVCPHCGAPLEFAVGSGATDGTISVVLQLRVK
jgi:uncharacterized protein (UPF0212 family)